MQIFVDLIAAMGIAVIVVALATAVAVALWVRTRRRVARRQIEGTLDRLAGQVAQRLAEGDAPGWALVRYERLSDDVRRARTWRALQQLILRERLLDEAQAAVRRAPALWARWRRSGRNRRRIHPAQLSRTALGDTIRSERH